MNKTLVRALILVVLLAVPVSCSGMLTSPTATPAPSATFAPTETTTPTATSTLIPTPRPTATITYTPTPEPAQVFAEPVLAAVKDIPPHFADDFSRGNRGWSWDKRQQSQVQIVDGVMKVNGEGGHGIFPPNNLLLSKNFIFEFDVRVFNENTGIGTFFRQQNANIFYSFVIRGDRQWGLYSSQEGYAGLNGRRNIQPIGGTNHIIIIARGDEFAVYLNGLPTAYLKDDTFFQAGNLMPTFHCSYESDCAQGEFDNFKFWDLDLVKLP